MAYWFQFLYGAIKSAAGIFFIVATKTFQFLYGAIKSTRTEILRLQELNFNSSMVRLKVNNQRVTDAGTWISIPLWCD